MMLKGKITEQISWRVKGGRGGKGYHARGMALQGKSVGQTKMGVLL